MQMAMRYIFDSNVYDYILDEFISVDEVHEVGEIFITNVQLSEIKNIPDVDRRQKILDVVNKIAPQKLQLLSGIWLDELQWDDEQIWHDDVSPECKRLLGQSVRNLPWMDALIGEVALRHELTLVTSDQKFAARAKSSGVNCVNPREILKNRF